MSITLNKPGTPMPLASVDAFVARWRVLLAGLDEPVSEEMERLVAQTLAGNAVAPMTLATTALVAAHARILRRMISASYSIANAESVLAVADTLYTLGTTLTTASPSPAEARAISETSNS